MTFNCTVLGVLQIVEVYPEGVVREEIYRALGKYEGASPEEVDRALARLLELGVAAERDGLVVPLAPLKPLAQKMERIVSRINRQERERDLAMGLVKMLLRGP